MGTDGTTFDFRLVPHIADERARGIVAKKCLAAFLGLTRTAGLSRHGVRTGEDAVAAVQAHLDDGRPAWVSTTDEPSDPSDKGRDGVDVAAVFSETERRLLERSGRIAAEVRSLMADELYGDAYDAAVGRLHEIPQPAMGPMLEVLDELGRVVEMASAVRARELTLGKGTPTGHVEGLAALEGISTSDNAVVAGQACLWLYEHHDGMDLPGISDHRPEAMKFRDKGAMLGNPDCLFLRGVAFQDGAEGPPDPERAAGCYREAVAQGHGLSLTNLALLLLRKACKPAPGEDWEAMLRKAASDGDAVAESVLGTVARMRSETPGLTPARLAATVNRLVSGRAR